MNYLITGCAGFIGYHLAEQLLKDNINTKIKIFGIDNLDNYYSTKLKKERIKNLKKYKNFYFTKLDINKIKIIEKKLKKEKINVIFHFAAQAGVRYTAINPSKYLYANLLGFVKLMNVIELINPKYVFYASSSSVYGDNKQMPFGEKLNLKPKNIYAFTKVANEIFSEYLSQKINTKFVGLRFFTVFGEWGRPDMLLYKYLNDAKLKKNFYLNNKGNDYRDFTYVKDVISIILLLLKKRANLKKHQIFNICSNKPIKIINLINFLKKKGFDTKITLKGQNFLEILKTHGNNSKIKKFVKFKKFSDFYTSIVKCLDWYTKNYKKF